MEDNKFSKDEENKRESLPEDREPKYKIGGFISGLITMLIPYFALYLYYKMDVGLGFISAFFLAILFAIAGTVLMVVARERFNKPMLGLGFFVGGLAPICYVFLFSGGCGLFGHL